MLTTNKAVYGTDGSLSELGRLKGSGSSSGKLVIIDDLVLDTPYVIDDTDISAFVVSQIVIHRDGGSVATFIMPATFIDTANIVEGETLYCQVVIMSGSSVALRMDIGCSFTRRSDGKVQINTNDINVDGISIGYFTK